MPTISIFYGIRIFMNIVSKEHNPPHIHARYGQYEATFKISDGEHLYGKFPPKATAMVKEFIDLYRNELIEMWNNQSFKKLQGLE